MQAQAGEPQTGIRIQTQVMKLDGNQITLDIYQPQVTPIGAAIVSHGFTRSRTTMSEHAQALAAIGLLVLTPDMPCTFDFRCNARSIAQLVNLLRDGGNFGGAVDRVMLVGFSAGGLSSLLAASTPGVVGFVGLDPFDRIMPGEKQYLGADAAKRLSTEALLIRAPASKCNAQSVAAAWKTELKALLTDNLIPGASHCDFEAPTDWICKLACGETEVSRQSIVRQGILDAASRWMR